MGGKNFRVGILFEYIIRLLAPLPLMLLVANFANTKSCKKAKKWLKPWHMDTHLRILSESYPMNTGMTRQGLEGFPK